MVGRIEAHEERLTVINGEVGKFDVLKPEDSTIGCGVGAADACVADAAEFERSRRGSVAHPEPVCIRVKAIRFESIILSGEQHLAVKGRQVSWLDTVG